MNLSDIKSIFIIIACACVIAFVGYLVWRKFLKPEQPKVNIEKILADIFGEPVYATNFSLREARDWVRARQHELKAGSKAVLCKVNSKTMHMFGQELKTLNVDIDAEKFLVVAIVNINNNFSDTLLVKYDKLTSNLEEALSDGDGTLVVEA